jgi:DHA2 family multidrug resistance protein
LLGIVGFIVWELIGTKRPIVDIRVLRYRSVSAGSVLAFAIGATLYGAIVIFPQYVQSVLGFTATDSGLLIFSRAIFIAVGTPFVVRFAVSGKIETRYLLLTGFFLIGVSQLWFAHITTSNTPFWTMVPPNMMSGFGLSLLFVPISLAILGGVPPQAVPKAASFQSLSQQLGGSISTAALVTLLARRQAFHQDILASNVTPASIPFAQFMQQHGQIGMLYGVVLNEASAISYADAQLAIGILAFVLIPVVFIMPQKKKDAPAVAPTFE